ncbi:hypothetical protein HZA97_01270 [Candidatus Woesearchaeota archaeon]|nr:hypothetical protein [Candidatus Woesearchaeota archaeon]
MKKVFAVLLVVLMLFLPISVSAQLAPASAPQSTSALQQFLNSPDLSVVVGKDSAASDQKIANDLYQQYSYNIREKILDQQRSSEKDIVPGKFLMAADTDLLELNETLGEVLSSVGVSNTPMLQGKWVNTKIDSSYQTQSIQFPNTSSTSGSGNGRVIFTKNEFEEAGTFLHWISGEEVYTYTLQFEPGLKSAANGSSNSQLADFIDRSFNIAGREYFVVNAKLFNSTKGSGQGIEIVLAHGAVQDEIGEGQVKTYAVGNKAYKVEAMIVSEDNREVLFKVNGETLPKLRIGELAPLKDGTVLSVRDVIRTKKDVQQTIVRFYLAPEFGELRIRDGDINDRTYEDNSLRINGELQENTDVIVRGVSMNPGNPGGAATSPTIVIIDRIQFRLKNKGMMDGNVYLKAGQKISETQMDPESFKTFFDIKYEGNANAKPLPQLKDDLRKKYAQQTLFNVNFNGNLEVEQLADVGGSRIGSTITVKHDKCDLLPQQAQAAENLAQRAKDLGKEDVAKEYMDRKEQLDKEYREDCLYGPQPAAMPEVKSAEKAQPILPSDAEVKACVEQKQADSVYQTAKKSLEQAGTEYAKKNFLDKLSALSVQFQRDCTSELTKMPEVKKESMGEEKQITTIKLPGCGTPRSEEVMMCIDKAGVVQSVVLYYSTDGLDLYMRAASPTGKIYDVPLAAHDNANDVGSGDRSGNFIGWYEMFTTTSGSPFNFPYSAKRDLPFADIATAGNWGGNHLNSESGDIVYFADKRFSGGAGLSFTAGRTAPDTPTSFEGTGSWWVAKIKNVEVVGTQSTTQNAEKVVLYMEDLASSRIGINSDGTLALIPLSQEEKSYTFQANLAANDDALGTINGADVDGDSRNDWSTEVIFRDPGSPKFFAQIDVGNDLPVPRLNFNLDASEKMGANTFQGISVPNAVSDPDTNDRTRMHMATITPLALDLSRFNILPEEGSGYLSQDNSQLDFEQLQLSLPQVNARIAEIVKLNKKLMQASAYTVGLGTCQRAIANDGSNTDSIAAQETCGLAGGATTPNWVEQIIQWVARNPDNYYDKNREPISDMIRLLPKNTAQSTDVSGATAAQAFLEGAAITTSAQNGLQISAKLNTNPFAPERLTPASGQTDITVESPLGVYEQARQALGGNIKVTELLPQGFGLTAQVTLEAQPPAIQQGNAMPEQKPNYNMPSQNDFIQVLSDKEVEEIAKKPVTPAEIEAAKYNEMFKDYMPTLSNDKNAVVSEVNKALNSPVEVQVSPGAKMPSKNLLLMGGSCANSLTMALTGLSCAEWLAKFPGGKSVIQALMFPNGKKALIIAGTNAADTKMSSDAVLQPWQVNLDYVPPQPNICGNGIVERGELCDPPGEKVGSVATTDGYLNRFCSADCKKSQYEPGKYLCGKYAPFKVIGYPSECNPGEKSEKRTDDGRPLYSASCSDSCKLNVLYDNYGKPGFPARPVAPSSDSVNEMNKNINQGAESSTNTENFPANAAS